MTQVVEVTSLTPKRSVAFTREDADAITEAAEDTCGASASSAGDETAGEDTMASVAVCDSDESSPRKPKSCLKAESKFTPPARQVWPSGLNKAKDSAKIASAPTGKMAAEVQLPLIGIIGLGDMGSMVAKKFCIAGYRVLGSDLPSRYEALCAEYSNYRNMTIMKDSTSVARSADIQVYAVDTNAIEEVTRTSGQATRVGACVLGLCNVKDPEIKAFDRWLPKDVSIVPVHTMHGPNVDSHGQTMVMIPHRCTREVADTVRKVFHETFGYVVQEMSVEDHDRITADTQVLTHVGLLAMGNAWCKMGTSPWERTSKVGGLEHIKVMTCLRSFALKAHAYSGVAMLNPRSRQQVKIYSDSVAELFKLMVSENEQEFTKRIMEARDALFSDRGAGTLLPPELLDEFSLSEGDRSPSQPHLPSSHLDILAAVDAWHRSGVNPFGNLVCETPVFRLRLGIAEYLFCRPELLQESIHAAVYNHACRVQDFEFVLSVKEWATIIAHGDVDAYAKHFGDCKEFFKKQVAKASTKSARLISWLAMERERPQAEA